MEYYDFIIVGAGAAGCLLASRLAKSLPQYSVLLLDAGGKNADSTHQSYGERHWTFMVAEGRNWGYRTIPQSRLKDREIDYSRGKGFGGSTAINFCVYTRGPSVDYDQWAEAVGDSEWSWDNAQRRFNKLETFHNPLKDYENFVNISTSAHGFDGPVDVGLPEIWDPSLGDFLNKLYQHQPKNLDHNSGNPVGVSISQVGARNGCRINAAEAFISPPPSNLTVVTEAAVSRILFDKENAIGIEAGGETCIIDVPYVEICDIANKTTDLAKWEVILSAGAIDSPKLLLLSGIGPEEELKQHGIQVIKDLPGVGKNLDDHLFLFLVSTQKPESHHRSSYIHTPNDLKTAREQWTKDKGGPLAKAFLPQMMAFLKSPRALASEEFQELDKDAQKVCLADEKPTFEILSQVPQPTVQEPDRYLGTMVGFQGGDASGEVRLRSSNPNDDPIIDPNYLPRPFDRRVAIEAVRATLELLDIPGLAEDRLGQLTGPDGISDEQIWDFITSAATSMWHASGTVKMGKMEEPSACVDKNFRVYGINGLRVVDMSIAPVLPSAHTQAVAYLIGETAADKIVADYL